MTEREIAVLEEKERETDEFHKEISKTGHRARLKEFIEQNGIESCFEHIVLEYLLFHTIPYKDTKPIAYELINRFGNLYGVFNAPPELIASVKGVTQDTVLLLTSLSGICDRYLVESGIREKINDVDGILHYMRKIVIPNTEGCYVINLDGDDEVVSVEKVLEGTDNSLNVPARLIIKAILNANARRIVILHNHPSGKVIPSSSDLTNSYTLAHTIDTLKIEMVDHIIVYEKMAYSIKYRKMYKHNWRMR